MGSMSGGQLTALPELPASRLLGGGAEPTVGPSQSWKGCPFVAILNLPGQPSQSAPFLLTFSSALIGGRSVTDP